MLKELVIGTTNPAKINQIKGALLPLDIKISNLIGLEIPEVIENGKTAQENAQKKATTYAKHFQKTILSVDNALFLDPLSESKQPGINVRRINGQSNRATDDKLLEYYSKLISNFGEQITGRWEFGFCVATPNKHFETTIISPRIFTNKKSHIVLEGFPLESIQIDPQSQKYISEMTPQEQDLFWQRTIGGKLQSFIKSINI